MLAVRHPDEAYAGKTVLVTGGAGFIGSHLVEALVAAKANVRVLDDLSSGARKNLEAVSGRIEFIEGDVCDSRVCLSAAAGAEIIFHEAALVSVPESIRVPDKAYAVNILGTSHIFEAANACHAMRVVYASSSAVYGNCTNMPLIEANSGQLMSPYAIGKRSSELLGEYAFTAQGLQSVGLRYFNVYGPRQRPDSPYAAAIPIFLSRVRSGCPPMIHGDGSQTRDFVHVSDVVRANLLAGVAQDVGSLVVNVGTGSATTVRSLAELICKSLGLSQEPLHGPARAGDIPHSVANPSKALQQLGFQAKVELGPGIANLIETWVDS